MYSVYDIQRFKTTFMVIVTMVFIAQDIWWVFVFYDNLRHLVANILYVLTMYRWTLVVTALADFKATQPHSQSSY